MAQHALRACGSGISANRTKEFACPATRPTITWRMTPKHGTCIIPGKGFLSMSNPTADRYMEDFYVRSLSILRTSDRDNYTILHILGN